MDSDRDNVRGEMPEPQRDAFLGGGTQSEREYAVGLLAAALEAYGGSASSLARRAGVSTSTITRPLKDPESSAIPKWATIARVMAAAGLDATPAKGSFTLKRGLQAIEVVGEIRPGVWFEDIDDRDYGEPLLLSLPGRHPSGPLSAYKIGEDSGYPPGTFLIVDQGLRAESGDLLVFRRMMGKLINTRVNRYEVSGGQHRILGSEILLDFKSFESISESSGGNQPGVLMGVVIGQLWVKP